MDLLDQLEDWSKILKSEQELLRELERVGSKEQRLPQPVPKRSGPSP